MFHTHPGQTVGGGVSTPQPVQTALLAESALRFGPKSTLFGRFERTQKDELFAIDDPRHNLVFSVNKINVGYSYDLLGSRPVALAGGVAVGVHLLPRELSLTYGKAPMALTFFARLKIR